MEGQAKTFSMPTKTFGKLFTEMLWHSFCWFAQKEIEKKRLSVGIHEIMCFLCSRVVGSGERNFIFLNIKAPKFPLRIRLVV